MSTGEIVVEYDEGKNFISVKENFLYPESLDENLQDVKNILENWKEIILPLYKILIWEKLWHPFAIFGVSTSIFLYIWISEMRVLTIISLLGLFITLADYFVPLITSSLTKPDSWTPQKEALLDTICGEILIIKMSIETDCSSFYKLRDSHPNMYVTFTVVALGMLAWVGSTFSNLLLVYLLVTSILLLPGAERTKVYSHLHGIQDRLLRDFISGKFPTAKKDE